MIIGKTGQASRGPARGGMGKALPLLVIIILPVVGGFAAFFLGNLLFPQRCTPEECLIRPRNFAWFLPGVVLAFGLIPFLLVRLERLLLQRRFNRPGTHLLFSLEEMEGHGLVKPFLWGGILLFLIAAYAIADNYLLLRRDTVVVDQLLEWKEHRFTYGELESIRRTEFSGKRSGDVEYEIWFQNGYRYRSRNNVLELNGTPEEMARRAGIRVDTVRG